MKTIYESFLKRTLLSILIVHLNVLCFAATYYVSSSGSDSNTGLTTSLPWQTLTKVNSNVFVAGDQILFKRGDIFYGTLKIQNSGASGNPITFGAYGTGEKPIITGFTTVTSWTNLGSNIWESTNAVSTLSTCMMVAINGINTPMGREPDSDYYYFQSHTSTSITSSNLNGSPNWTGAELALSNTTYSIERLAVSSQSGGTLNFNSTGIQMDGLKFIIQNDARTLDTQNEWYYNPSTKKIRIYSIAQPSNVKISTVDILVNSTEKNYITFENIEFTGSNKASIYLADAKTFTIQNCNFSYSGNGAIYGIFWGTSSNLKIENCTIDQSNGGAIGLTSDFPNAIIRSNTITNTGLIFGAVTPFLASPTDFGQFYGISAIGAGTLIENNTIQNTGYIGIRFKGNNTIVRNNFVDGFCKILTDGGGIYTYNGGGGICSGMKVLSNIILNSPSGEGIYLDDQTNGVLVSGNTVSGCSKNFYLHNTYNTLIRNNTAFDAVDFGIYLNNNDGGVTMSNNVINSNVFVAKSATEKVLWIDYMDRILPVYLADSNYYARPMADNTDPILYFTRNPFGGAATNLSGWKTYTNKEAHSKKSPVSVSSESDIQFIYNETSTAKTFTLNNPSVKMDGTKVTGAITLQSYASVVVIKDLTPAIAPAAPTSVVVTAGNASASVTFVAPANNGGSAITGYTVTSIPVGGTDGNAGSTALNHSITGLTNGISYTFTVKATNSVGSSLASVASNSVTPKAPAATAFTFTGPTSGNVNSASSNFTVTPNNLYTGTITITPTGIGSAGLSPKVLTFSSSASAQTFTITPTVVGSITLTPTNNGTLTNPVPITYTTNAILPDAPTSVVATSGDANVSVTFMAPTNTGGSAITGYTVTSSPAGGIDINARSTSLTHTITGLTNGTYTFTVKATNSVGSSVASVASNPVENVIIKQGEIVPSHFTTVWQGLNGLNHVNINVVSATLEDLPLSVDDEIAVFSGSACVGASKLTQSIVPSDNTTFVTILASQNDGSGNGFADNDTIVFKIWNNKTQKELQINSVVYHSDISSWKTNGRYSPASTAVVELASYQVYTQSIELLKGYNMISTYLSAQNPNVSAVTKTILDQGNLIKLQDETGNSFENWGTFGGWINQLGSLEETEGYKIQVANNCTLQVTGRSIAMPFDIPLKTGWNIISFPRTDVVNAINVVQSLIDQNKLVKVQDEAGNSIENWGLFGGWKNGIGNFIPGKAYKVKMSADVLLTFQESYPKSALVLAQSEKTEYFNTSIEGNGTDHMNINITELNSINISAGDELAAFDGDICVATIKITETNLKNGSVSLVPSFSTDDQYQNGFKVGDAIQIIAWSKLSGDESNVIAEVITGQMKYEKNATVLIKLKSASTSTVVANLADAIKIDVFPNPCQGRLTVRFSEIPEADSRIEISDISGRKLITRPISGNTEEFNLDSFTPGLYLVRSILGSNEFVQKLIVNK